MGSKLAGLVGATVVVLSSALVTIFLFFGVVGVKVGRGALVFFVGFVSGVVEVLFARGFDIFVWRGSLGDGSSFRTRLIVAIDVSLWWSGFYGEVGGLWLREPVRFSSTVGWNCAEEKG